MKTVWAVILTAFVMFFIGHYCGYNQLISFGSSPTVDVVVTMSPTPRPTPTPAPSFKALAKGDRGEEVTALQERLAKFGYDVGTIDGIYGNKTAAAVSAFQQNASLKPTGNADSSTLGLLFSTVAYGYPADPPASPTPTPTIRPTPVPTRKPTATPKPTAPPKKEKTVYITDYGECWHTKPNCGNIKTARPVTLSYAKEHGYRNCSNC